MDRNTRTLGSFVLIGIILAGSIGGGNVTGNIIEEVEAYSLSTQIDYWVGAGATTIVLRAPIEIVTGQTNTFVISPGEDSEEIVTVTSVAGRTATLDSGLSKAHLAGDLFVRHIIPVNIANRTRQLFVPITEAYNATGGATVSRTDEDAEGFPMVDAADVYAYGDFHVPADYVSGGTLDIVVISNASGNMYGKLTADFGAHGENWNANNVTSGFLAVAVEALKINRVSSMSITLTNLAAGDYISATLLRQGSHANDTVGNTVYARGFIFNYTADS